MLAADYIFGAAIIFVVSCNLYFGPRISGKRIAMQWGLDGKPTWYASKRLALWGTIPFMLAVRLFIWLASIYTPQMVHGAELGIAGFAVIVAGSQLFILKRAESAG
jgi:hypothetical protein